MKINDMQNQIGAIIADITIIIPGILTGTIILDRIAIGICRIPMRAPKIGTKSARIVNGADIKSRIVFTSRKRKFLNGLIS